jgi:uncharacterized protein (TIGR00290 family)
VPKLFLSWSGGKDSVLALRALRQSDQYHVVGLLTTFTEDFERVSMHGVRRTLLRAQANAIGIPLIEIYISKHTTNNEYEATMTAAMLDAKAQAVHHIAFGDLYLEDVRAYREETLAKINMLPVFPMWGRDTTPLAQEFIDSGFEAVVVCVDSQQLDGSFVGRDYNHHFLADLPNDVDPCGENGEFHTLVHDGPTFTWPVPIRKGDIVLRENRFYYCDFDLSTRV